MSPPRARARTHAYRQSSSTPRDAPSTRVETRAHRSYDAERRVAVVQSAYAPLVSSHNEATATTRGSLSSGTRRLPPTLRRCSKNAKFCKQAALSTIAIFWALRPTRSKSRSTRAIVVRQIVVHDCRCRLCSIASSRNQAARATCATSTALAHLRRVAAAVFAGAPTRASLAANSF